FQAEDDIRDRNVTGVQTCALPIYGFEIYNRVLNKTDNLYELKETTLYSSYKRLEKDGFIQSYWGDETQGGRRKYYRITELGRELYQQKLKDYEFTKKIL